MISAILSDYKKLFDTYFEVGKSMPAYNGIDYDKKNFYDANLWDHLSKSGIHGLSCDESYGGKGFPALKCCAAFEGLANGCDNNGLLFSSAAHLLACALPLNMFGSDTQKKEYLNGIASGKIVAANAITEANAGSDVFNMSAFAERQGNKYIINGEKKFITNAPIANVFLVYVLTDKAKGFFGGVSAFLIKADTKGLKVSEVKDKMGLRTAQMANVTLTNVEVSEGDMLGKEGAGAQIFNVSMMWERTVMSAFLIGQLNRVLSNSISFFRTRKIGDKSLYDFQDTKNAVTEIKTALNAGRNLVYDAAYAIDNKSKDAMAKASIAKLFVSENVVNSIKRLQGLYGGYGYLTEASIEREYRDAYAALIYSGTSAIQKNIIAGAL